MSNPKISNVSYNASLGVLKITGTQLTAGIALGKLTLTNAAGSYTLNPSDDILSNFSANGFTVTLGTTGTAAVNAFFNSNGSNDYQLLASTGWDAGSGDAIAGKSVTVSGNISLSGVTTGATLSDVETIHPFAKLTIADSNPNDGDSAKISFSKANGTLSGSGLSAGVVSGDVISYTLVPASPADLQKQLQNLEFTPTLHQVAPGASVSTTFSLTVEGSPLITPSQTLSSGINRPSSIAIDGNGNVFVANRSANTVEKFSADGKLLLIYSIDLSAPTSLAVDSSGSLFVANYNNSTLTKFNSAGTWLFSQSAHLALSYPENLALDASGNVMIANYGGDRLEVFDTNGNWLHALSSGISRPKYVTTDSNGNILVANIGNNTVVKLDASGTLLQTFSQGISGPQYVTSDGSGNVFVANAGNKTVEKFSSSGELLLTLSAGISNPKGIAIDSHGNLFIANADTDTIEEFSPTGKLLLTYRSGLSGPTRLALDSQDNLYVSNYNSNTVEKFAPVVPSNPITTVNNDTQITVTAAEPPTLTSVSYDAGKGKLTLTGAHLTASAGDYQPWNFRVTGQDGVSMPLYGDIVAKPNGTQAILTLDSATQQTIGGILNQNGALAIDGTAYSLSASGDWDKGAAEIGNLALGVSHVIPPKLSSVSYNAITGTLAVSGSHLINVNKHSITLDKLSLNAGNSHFSLDPAADSLNNFSAQGFSVTLSETDRIAVNAFFNGNGVKSGSNAYSLSAEAGWDSGSGDAIAGQKVTVSGNLALGGISTKAKLTDIGSIHPFAKLTISNPSTIVTEAADISFQADNGRLSGNGLSDGVSDNGVIHYHLSATDPSALQLALRNLVFTPTPHQVAAGQSIVSDFKLDIIADTSVMAPAPSMTLDSSSDQATSIATDSAGNFFVAYANDNLVREFSASGELINSLGYDQGILVPEAIKIDASGNLFVVNYAAQSVEKFSPNGELLLTLSEHLTSPGSIAIDSKGNIYVANQYDDTVEKFSANGAWLQSLGNGIASPKSLAIDSQDNLFVSNGAYSSQTVAEFSASGTLVRTLTKGMSYPGDLAIDGQGNLYVANTGNNTVEEFSPNGALLRTLSDGILSPQSIVVDSHGDLFVANLNGDSVTEYSASGELLQTLTNGISSPNTLAIDSDGNLLVTNQTSGAIVKFSSAELAVSNSATHITVSGTPNPSITTTSYDAASGKLTLKGKNFSNASADYVLSDLTLSGQSGLHYTLTGGTISGKPGSSKVTIMLSSADQLAVNGLLGHGGNFSLSAAEGWDKGGPAIQPVAISVAKFAAPTLSAASYNIATGTLTVSGGHLANLDGDNGITPAAFTLHAGNQSYSLSADSVQLSNAGTGGFTLTLNDDAKLALNALFTVNGSNDYSLSVAAGWDGSNSAAVDAKTVTVSGNIALSGLTANASLDDTATLKPFALLTLADSNSNASDGARISFTAANGTLSGTGLSDGVIENGIVTYTLSTTKPATLQQELRDLLFTPTKHQVAEGGSVETNFTLTVTGSLSAPAFASDASTHVTVTATAGPIITAALYDADAGTLTLNGSHLTTSASDYQPENITLTGQNGFSYSLVGATISANPTANQAIINLSAADQLALNALLNLDGNQAHDATVYNLSATADWDKEASAIGKQALTATHTSEPSLTGADYDVATGILSVTGAHLAKFGNDLGLSLSNFTLNAGNKSLTLNPVTDTLSSIGTNGFSVTLSADDQAAVNAFFNNNGIKSNTAAYTLSATSAWDAGQGAAINAQSITVKGNAGSISLSGFSDNFGLSDNATTHPFAAITVSDGNPYRSDSVIISFATANGTLSGNGLSTGTINGDTISYTLAPTTPSALEEELRNLTFTPTPHQVAAGQTVDTVFSLTVEGNASVLATTPVKSLSGAGNCLAIDSNSGKIVAAYQYGSTIKEYSSSGELLWTRIGSDGINKPSSVAFDNNGNIWVTNNGNNTLQEFSSTGTLLHTLSAGISIPVDVVSDSSGNIYVANQGTKAVEKFSPSGVLLQTFTGTAYPTCIAIDRTDNVFIATNVSITKYSADGTLQNTITKGISSVSSVAIDNLGNLFVASDVYNNVNKYAPNGDLLLTLTNGMSWPTDVAVDSNGNLFVLNSHRDSYSNYTLQEFSDTGILMQTISKGLDSPYELAIDTNGNAFVANFGNTILEFSPAFTTTASVTYLSPKTTITATANHFDASPNADLNHPTNITGAHAGDTVTIADATGFIVKPIGATDVSASGGDATKLKGWVDAALSAQGANLASHNIAWFSFSGDTYLVEQANAQGSSYAAGDTLVQLVGSFDVSTAGFSGHTLTL